MNRTAPTSRARRAILLAISLVGCHESLAPIARAPQPALADQLVLQLVASAAPEPGMFLVRAVVTVGADAGRVGGFRARLVLPPDVTPVGDVSAQTDAVGDLLRIVRLDGADVLATGVSAEGVTASDLFVVRVQASESALRGVRIEMAELVDKRGTDRLRGAVVIERLNVIARKR